jgi:hypothetical protein
VVEINPVTKAIEWQYADAPHQSFSHIADAAGSRLFEVTPKGETVWEYENTAFRTYRYPKPQARL